MVVLGREAGEDGGLHLIGGERMIEIMPESYAYVLGFKLSGEITDADYTEVFIPALNRAIEKYGTIRVLIDVIDYNSEDIAAMDDDSRIEVMSTFSSEDSRIGFIEREAIVGGEEWEIRLSTVDHFFLFPNTDVRFFREDYRREAWNWVCEGMDKRARVRSPISR